MDAMMGIPDGAIDTTGMMPATPEKSDVQRGIPEKLPEDERAAVAAWQAEILADKEFFKEDFALMRENQHLARYGADKAWVKSKKYRVPIINRHLNQAVSALYAKNPKAVAKRRPRLNNSLWDGKPESVQQALQLSQAGDPMGAAIIQEIQDSQAQNALYDRMGRTMEILFSYYTGENTPNFKQQMKSHVRRTKTCGVGYAELDFQRILEKNPDVTSSIDDMTNQIALIESRLADVTDGLLVEGDVKLAELKSMLSDLQQQETILVREGLVIDFVRSTEIIPHRGLRQLRGFIGSDYVTREFHMTPEQIQETYKIDVGRNYRAYNNATATASSQAEGARDVTGGATGGLTGNKPKDKACVWRVQNKRTRQVFTIVEGYPAYVKKPEAQPLEIDGFWSIFALTFNEVEDEEKPIPPSDVEFLRDPQKEYNSTRQGLREHRQANRPKYFAKRGMLSESDKVKLETYQAHAVIEVSALETGVAINQVIQAFQGVPIDPNLYETQSIVKDILYGVGTQDANLGPTSGATATESSISEQSRMSTLASNVDDLDEHLSDIARAASQIMLKELSLDTVREIVGPGAVWPEHDRESISKELYLDIKAGSSGRPNKAADLANMERGLPYLLQLPGISGYPLGRRYADLLDIDIEDLVIEGAPSIVALNAMAAKMGVAAPNAMAGNAQDPQNAPAAQGGAGAQNAPAAMANEPGPQPGYTTGPANGGQVI